MPRKTSPLTVIDSLLSKARAIFQPGKQVVYALLPKGGQRLQRLIRQLGQWRGSRGSHYLQTERKRRWSLPFRHTRSMVSDILILQLVFTSFLGLLAIGGLWVISQTVIQDNLQKWAQAW
ncbi:MAG: hypothetical protein ABFS45_21965, partial [Pseudomonadota bacterium]